MEVSGGSLRDDQRDEGIGRVGLTSMLSKAPGDANRGSWRWTLYIAELTAWGATALIFVILHVEDLSSTTYRQALLVTVLVAAALPVLFRFILPRARSSAWVGWAAMALSTLAACVFYGLLRAEVPSAQLVFVPLIVIAGLVAGFPEGVWAGLLASVGYWVTAVIAGGRPDPVAGTVNSMLFLLSGSIAGLLASEMRSHYSAEQEEHRLATAVRHRLLAVLDAVDEAIVFRDRRGITRVVNQRAGRLFELDPDSYLGEPTNELLRSIARKTEDPEGFMETFQELRDDPEVELRVWVDQILPHRRQLRLYSGPTFDENGALVGRIDVYTDITESVSRSAEVERLFEEARRTAESYQRGLLPDSVPSVPRINFVSHYVPASGRRAVCGDFYDFIPLSDGRMGLVLGDVCGIGPGAASDAAFTRYTLRSLANDTPDPAQLMNRLNAHIQGHIGSERFVRMLFAALDPERAVIEYVNAGHVPPVVHRFDTGEVQWLEEGALPLGVEEDLRFKAAHVDLHPGDMLVLYTDGVTEAPRAGLPFGQSKFSDIVAEYGIGTPGELVQAIRRSVEAWAFGGELRDDIALVVCQVIPDATIGEPTRELVLPNEPARVAEVRAFVLSFLADLRAPIETSQELLLAVSEAAANASRHGRNAGARSELRIRCALEGGIVRVVVADDGPGFDASEVGRPDLPDRFSSGGRGVFLMYQLTDSVEVRSGPNGTTVALARDVFGGRRPPEPPGDIIDPAVKN
ncbi:MAG: SpoIIE family protein phosphatase [Actinomycetota bacterium]